jgi:hypothetical protein
MKNGLHFLLYFKRESLMIIGAKNTPNLNCSEEFNTHFMSSTRFPEFIWGFLDNKTKEVICCAAA